MLSRVVWSAVVAAILAIGAVAAAIFGENNNLVAALGMSAITAAVLATRER